MVTWRGILAPLDKPTGDRRILATPPNGEARAPELTLLRYQPQDWGAHDGAISIGSIDRVWVEDGNVMATGRFDMQNPIAVDVVRKIQEGFAGGISIDPDEIIVSPACYTNGKLADCTEDSDPDSVVSYVSDWRIRAATLVDIPAFSEAKIWIERDDQAEEWSALVAAESGSSDLPLASRDHVWDGPKAEQRVAEWARNEDGELDASKFGRAFFYRDPELDPKLQGTYKLGFADVIDGELFAIPRGIFAVAGVLEGARGGVDIPDADKAMIRARVGRYYERMADEFEDDSIVAPWDRAMAAATGNWAKSWFEYPGLEALATGLPTFDGPRFYGRVAQFNACHTGYRDLCMTAPKSQTEYSMFHRIPVETNDGALMVGRITTAYGNLEGACGHPSCAFMDDHACAAWNLNRVFSHHDSMETAAYVRVGEDEEGIWFSGVLSPTLSEQGRAVLERQMVSGHWMNDGELVEVLALAKRDPGFPPKARQQDGRMMSLVAAGHVMRRPVADEDVQQDVSEIREEVAELRKMVENFSSTEAKPTNVTNDREQKMRALKLAALKMEV